MMIKITRVHEEDYTIPSGPRAGEVIKERMGYSVARASIQKDGSIMLVEVQVEENYRGQGIATELVGELVEKAGRSVTTSRLFSDSGKALMESLVKKGLANRVGSDDYKIHIGRQF